MRLPPQGAAEKPFSAFARCGMNEGEHDGEASEEVEADYLHDWPQWGLEDQPKHWLTLLVLAIVFLVGPILAPCCAVCVVANQALKAKCAGFDVFVMAVIVYFLGAMFTAFLNTVYVLLGPGDDMDGWQPNANVDRYGPLIMYAVMYAWLAWVLTRHFRSLSSDRYNPNPAKLQDLRGVPFDPPLVPPPDVECDDIRDVPDLLAGLCLYADIFSRNKRNDDDETSDVGSDIFGSGYPAAATNTTSADFMHRATWFDRESTSQEEEDGRSPSAHNTNWAIPFIMGNVIAIGERAIVIVFFSDNKSWNEGSWGERGRAVFWLSNVFWLLWFAVIAMVTLALFTLYYRQLRTLVLFSSMTKLILGRKERRFHFINLQSTRNLLLWHEARTYLVDQVMKPTSFLRAVFDPTCAVMLVSAASGGIYLAVKHVFTKTVTPFDELSAVVATNVAAAVLFFYFIITFTRLIQRELREHEGLIVREKLRVLNRILKVDEELARRSAVYKATVLASHLSEAETTCTDILGSAFTIAELSNPLVWRQAGTKICSFYRKGKAEQARRLESALRVLEPTCYQHTVSGCSWGAMGDYVCHFMGAAYLVPPCGSHARQHYRQAHHLQFEAPHRKRAELLRRLRVIESILIHVAHLYIRPKILGFTLTMLLSLGLFVLIVLSTILMLHITTDPHYSLMLGYG
ncbi:hypothetical protein DIPPA_22582 [Diplonema papillatum]|nr:hypothetical protein DIPPA_22582 [Diplonema papillatum]